MTEDFIVSRQGPSEVNNWRAAFRKPNVTELRVAWETGKAATIMDLPAEDDPVFAHRTFTEDGKTVTVIYRRSEPPLDSRSKPT